MSVRVAAGSGRRFRGQSAEERRAQRRERLIEAGLETFGTRGFHAVGVREVCAQAGLTERYFYESFDNREALFLAVYEHAVELVRAALLDVLARNAKDDPLALARKSLRRYLETLRDEPRLVRVLLIDVHGVGADVGNRSIAASRSFTELVLPTIEALYPELTHSGINAQLVADGLIGATVFSATQWAIDGFTTPLEDVVEHCALFFEAIAETLDRRCADAG